jgi:hypothetical protein
MFDGKPAPTGMEIMLKSLGLGPVIEAANTLATSGAVQKIVQFADLVGPLREQLDRIERRQLALLAAAGLPDPCPALGGPGPAGGSVGPMALEHRTPGQPGSAGAASRLPDPGPQPGAHAAE